MSDYLKPLNEAFERVPVGSYATGRDRRSDLQAGYVAPVGFGVVTEAGAENFGRAWVTLVRDAPVDGLFNTSRDKTWKVWADTLTAAIARPSAVAAVTAHMLVSVTFKPGEADDTEAMRAASTLVEKVLVMAKQVDSFYIRQLGTANTDS